ncbi:MAG: bifunctional phosphoribosylaminoimidazolecarboxamide formyltransferase/IMP cyclohydrolase [Saprospiraceae bacterium]|nr:bifunctional phosphoribosylaminoimidazolecarboxamide formyltransferase/IMP cyclohydrolase [Saprospiraceae bacterium]
MAGKKIKSALISVFHKEGLEPIVRELHRLGVIIYSTGGTQSFIEELGVPVQAVEDLTSYPSILDGRVKTLHPKIFGGILARREESHLTQLAQFDIPEIDLVMVDLYPFEATVAQTDDESAIIEKIDIGGISLIRAAAKNYKDVVIIPSMDDYARFLEILQAQQGETTLADRHYFALRAFGVSSHYDAAIFSYFNRYEKVAAFRQSFQPAQALRYGENPHQKGFFHGDLTDMFDVLGGKALSYNNLVDVDAAVSLMAEFQNEPPTFAILKHTNSCGVATRPTLHAAWSAALAADNVSAFGGILIANTTIDIETASAIDTIFYEVLIAPAFTEEALTLLQKKKKRILLRLKAYDMPNRIFKRLLNGVIEQDTDRSMEVASDLTVVTKLAPTADQTEDLLFANKIAKHLKSNSIVLAKDQKLLAMGCGQTSRVDALKQAIDKAGRFGFQLEGAVMASDAFFPFADCVEIAHRVGVKAVIQPGGSIRDQDSIDYCDAHDIAMVTSGVRHFKH